MLNDAQCPYARILLDIHAGEGALMYLDFYLMQ